MLFKNRSEVFKHTLGLNGLKDRKPLHDVVKSMEMHLGT